MALARSSARARLSSRLTCARRASCIRLSTTTTAPTMIVTPRTCLPLMPKRIRGGFGAWVLRCLALLGLFRPESQLVQLVVESLQADAQNFRGAGLVVAGVLQGHHDQPPFGLFDGRARRECNLRLVLRQRLVGEHRRQMPRLDERAG